jgi:hypothetical protein
MVVSDLHEVAIWIARHEAVLVRPVQDPFRDGGVLSDLGVHLPRGWAKQHITPSVESHPEHPYDDLVSRLRRDDRILILGPGDPKHRLHQKISSLHGQFGEVLDVRNAHEMTEDELVRRAERFFGRYGAQEDQE